ncbi:MAG: DUF3047 domain-containing protein [Deltaproteobacteria bacterium]|nr:DUF3047 domain-containing protein [Deltaproteobacteria bacterium]
MQPNSTNNKAIFLILVVMAFLTGDSAVLAESPSVIEVGDFSAEKMIGSLPAHWEPLYFKSKEQHTDYSLVREDGQVVVKALADGSASMLRRKISIDPKEYPIIQWRWKVANILKKGNVYQKDGDDDPARIYVTFAYDPTKLGFFENIKYKLIKVLYGEYPPLAALTYIWASNAPKGLVVPNPFTDRAMMVVVESGAKNVNSWIDEERDIYGDYRNAFGDEPPMISGVAIMTDTDNTGESATAYYGDIRFRKRRR